MLLVVLKDWVIETNDTECFFIGTQKEETRRMTATITFFAVGNGDMTLIAFDNGQTLLTDINIRAAADNEEDSTPDVGNQLRDRLKRDGEGRLFVDGMLLTHPDADHCTGLENHFHLGPPEDWSKAADKILIREMWSSPIVFRRASTEHTICPDAKAWAAEARRRVKLFREKGFDVAEGDRIVILAEDEAGKTDDILGIVVKVDEEFSTLNRVTGGGFVARLLGPLPILN